MNDTAYQADFDLLRQNVPADLRERTQWVAWCYEQVGGKPTKVPISPSRGGNASSNDPSTWATFDEAIAACCRSDDLAGIGCFFSAEDPYCGIDLDHCIDEDGNLKPWARSIVDELDSYSEISPSGKGVKIVVRARKPGARCKVGYFDGAVEIYDHGRYFTFTGNRLESVSANVEDRQNQVEALYSNLFGASANVSTAIPLQASPNPAAPASDEDIVRILERSQSGNNFKRLWEGHWSNGDGKYPSQSDADLALVGYLTFMCGNDPDRINRIFRQSALYREKWDRADYRARTINKALAGRTEFYGPVTEVKSLEWEGSQASRVETAKAALLKLVKADPDNSAPPRPNPIAAIIRPTILIDTEEHRAVAETVSALGADPDIYQRGGVLVRVLRAEERDDDIRRSRESTTIGLLPTANLRERMTKYVHFTKYDRKGNEEDAHPAAWLVSAIDVRGEWPGIRPLQGISNAPILRPDGTLFQEPGYDAKTGVLYEPTEYFPPIPDDVNQDDADLAVSELFDVVCDFRFESEAHRSAWLAGLLTPLGRFAFEGPSPMFLIDANIRGAGKGLLAQTIGYIALGHEMPVSSYAKDSEEMRKKLTSIAIAGDRLILFDNLEGTFGNDSLDRALTSTRWKDRILGKNIEVDLPLLPCWYATGNNVQVAADTTRRTIHIRLDVLEEKPEERHDFKRANLVQWIKQNRAHLLTRALTILVAYCRAERPRQDITPFGSFEGWSALVREAIVWAGLPDPCITRIQLAEAADTTRNGIAQLVHAWQQYDPTNKGLTWSAVMRDLYPGPRDQGAQDDGSVAMREAIENIVNCPPSKSPTARQMGNALKKFRRHVVDGKYLDIDPHRSESGVVWRLYHAQSGI